MLPRLGSDFMINMQINCTRVPVHNQEKDQLKETEGPE
jgi:hypothetical protein